MLAKVLEARSAFPRCESVVRESCGINWQDTKVSHAWLERHGSGISLFFHCFPDMTITFASIQMVKQNVEETDTPKIITKISCDRVDYE